MEPPSGWHSRSTLTREQFRAGETFTEPAVEEPLITRRNPERYERLEARVRAALG